MVTFALWIFCTFGPVFAVGISCTPSPSSAPEPYHQYTFKSPQDYGAGGAFSPVEGAARSLRKGS